MSCYGLNIDREKHPIHSDDDSVWILFILRKKYYFIYNLIVTSSEIPTKIELWNRNNIFFKQLAVLDSKKW